MTATGKRPLSQFISDQNKFLKDVHDKIKQKKEDDAVSELTARKHRKSVSSMNKAYQESFYEKSKQAPKVNYLGRSPMRDFEAVKQFQPNAKIPIVEHE